MFIKVTRSQAVTALLEGRIVWCGDNSDVPHGQQLGAPQYYSRRQAAKFLTKFFYGDAFYPRYAKICYWITG